jgi:hypothetical protein
VHAAFYLSPQAVSIGLIGPGGVGGHLLDQLAGEIPRLARESRLDLRVRAVTGSGRMLLAPRVVDLDGWRDSAGGTARPTDLEAFTAHVQAEHLPHAVIIDCSGSAEIAARYADWLARGIHVITPSKLAASGPLAEWRRAAGCAARGGRPLSGRDHGRRRPADHPDAQGPAPDRRRDHRHRGHPVGHARLPVQRLRRHPAVFLDRARGAQRSATPSPTRATTCPGATWRASW